MHPSRLVFLLGAASALAACSPRPPDANPDASARTGAAPVRSDATSATTGTAPGSGMAPRNGASRVGPSTASLVNGPGATPTARDPSTSMGAPAAAATAPSSAGTPPISDQQLTALVRAQLAAARDLADASIDVDARAGVVTLSGAVRSAAIKARASEIARSVRGVTEVNDQLTLAMG